MEGHASWDRQCPVFLNKCQDMDARMTENQMPYYPTGDPWTHALRPPKPAPPVPKPVQPQPRTQTGTTGTKQAAGSSRQQAYRQATLNFPPSQAAPQQSNGSGAAPPSSTQGEWPARDASNIPTGHAKPWEDGEEGENEDPMAPHFV